MAPANVCDTTSFVFEDLAQLHWIRYIFIFLYTSIILLSVIGNVFVIFTIYSNKHMRTVTNYYIVNLAMCDLLVAVFVMPLKLLECLAPCSWHVFGHDTMCSVVSFLLPVFVFASVLTLVAISLERWETWLHIIGLVSTESVHLLYQEQLHIKLSHLTYVHILQKRNNLLLIVCMIIILFQTPNYRVIRMKWMRFYIKKLVYQLLICRQVVGMYR